MRTSNHPDEEKSLQEAIPHRRSRMEINKQVIGIAAGVLGSLFVGYCIYFDHKRRVDPEYKKKVRDREYLSTVQSQGLV